MTLNNVGCNAEVFSHDFFYRYVPETPVGNFVKDFGLIDFVFVSRKYRTNL